MAYRRYVVAVLLFVAVVGIAFATLQIADTARGQAGYTEEFVENESIVQEVGLWQFVNEAFDEDTAGFTQNVTVYNASGVELTRGTDYEWNATDGSITYFNTASVTDGATGNISYLYRQNTQPVNMLSLVVDPIVAFVSWSPLMVGGLGLSVLLLFAAAIVSRVVSDNSVQRRR